MRIGRAILIPVILVLGSAGSILAGSATAGAATHAPAAHAHSLTVHARPDMHYYA
jgi:hypothetical protein